MANSYTGATNVNGGALFVNGSITSPTTVGAAGTLGGDGDGMTTGLIDGLLLNNGTVDPGSTANTIGTLTTTGTFTAGAGSTLHIDTDGMTNDLLVADTAILSGNGAVFVHELTGSTPLVEGQHYTFLQAPSGVTGQFASVSDDLPMINILLGYELDSVYFYFVSSSTNYAAVANTPNELSIATYLDQTAPTASGDYQTVIDNLNLLNADQLRLAFNQMGGESLGTAGQTTINTTTLSLQQVGNHLSSMSMFGSQGGGPTTNLMAQVSPTANPAASPNNIQLVSHTEAAEPTAKRVEASCLVCDTCANEKLWNGWSVGYGLGGSAQGSGGVSGASYGVGGFVAGVDRWIDDSTLVGVFGGYLGSSFSTGTPSARVQDNAGQGGLYAQRRGDVFYVSGLIGGQSDQYTSHRNINFAAINRTAVGNYDGWQGFGYSELGANLTGGNLTLQPYGAMQYIHLRQNSISETGAGSINLASGGMDTDSLRSFLGTRLRYDHHGENNLRRFIPELQASWLHEYIDASTALNARFGAVGGNGFITNGLNVGRDWALLGAGLTFVVTDNARLTANYYAQTNDRQTYHVGSGGVNLQW